MKDKVQKEKALADSYAETNRKSESLDNKVNKLLTTQSPTNNKDLLAKLRGDKK